MKTQSTLLHPGTLGAVLFALFALIPSLEGVATAQPYESANTAGSLEPTDGSYSYFRTVDGEGTLFLAESNDREEVEMHRPVLPGDRVWVAPGSRLELELSDLSVLRLAAETEITLAGLAGSPDSRDRASNLRLRQGDLQWLLFDNGLNEEPSQIRTANATIYLHDAGSYRVSSDGRDWTWVVVREGYGEVVTERGSVVLRAGEEAQVHGREYPRTQIANAGGLDFLERWGRDLETAARRADDSLGPDLRYSGAPLEDYGEWLEVAGDRAWRPYGEPNWRPYVDGRWARTPRGLSWVSSEPWGWVPYHYGSWDLVPSFGWVWFPGRRFAVANVTWYWGSGYVAWIPSGRYHRYYRTRFGWDPGFSVGLFGHAGGHWDLFDDWVFCPTAYLGHRRQRSYAREGRTWRRESGWREVPRGIITTDTGPLAPSNWKDLDEVERRLQAARKRQLPDGDRRAELPDLTSYLERRGDVAPNLKEALREARKRPSPAVNASEPKSRSQRPVPTLPTRPQVRDRNDGRAKDPTPSLEGRAPGPRPDLIPRRRDADGDLEDLKGSKRKGPEVEAPQERRYRPPVVRRPAVEKQPNGGSRRPSPTEMEVAVPREPLRTREPKVDRRRSPRIEVERRGNRPPVRKERKATKSATPRARPAVRSVPAPGPRRSPTPKVRTEARKRQRPKRQAVERKAPTRQGPVRRASPPPTVRKREKPKPSAVKPRSSESRSNTSRARGTASKAKPPAKSKGSGQRRRKD